MKPATASLTRSRQDYVKALFALGQGVPVTVTALARALQLSAPSVTNMLARLSGEHLVVLGHRGSAQLTAKGEREALQMVRRHRILEAFLVRVLGLDWTDVHEDAEVLEHHVSERVLDAMSRHMQNPTEDPHGHPIPDRRGRLPRRRLGPVAALPTGARAVVREIRDHDRRRMTRWKQAGLVPGAEVRMREADEHDGMYEIEVAGKRHVLSRAGLEGVLVERRPGQGRA